MPFSHSVAEHVKSPEFGPAPARCGVERSLSLSSPARLGATLGSAEDRPLSQRAEGRPGSTLRALSVPLCTAGAQNRNRLGRLARITKHDSSVAKELHFPSPRWTACGRGILPGGLGNGLDGPTVALQRSAARGPKPWGKNRWASPESGKRIVVTATSICSFLKENDPVHLSISGPVVAISSSPDSLTSSLRVVDVAEVP